MSLIFGGQVDWDAYVDEFRWVWGVVERESQVLWEDEDLMQLRVNLASQMIINHPESYERFKWKIHYGTLTLDEITEIRRLLGYLNPIQDTWFIKYW